MPDPETTPTESTETAVAEDPAPAKPAKQPTITLPSTMAAYAGRFVRIDVDPNGSPPADTARALWDFTIPVPSVALGTPTKFSAGEEVTDPELLTLFVRYQAPVEWAEG